MQLVRRLYSSMPFSLSLSFLIIPRAPLLLLIFWMSRNIVFLSPPRLPFLFPAVDTGGGPRPRTISPFSLYPSLHPSSPLVMIATLRCTRPQKLHRNRRRRRRRRRIILTPLDCYVIYKLLYRVITGGGERLSVVSSIVFFLNLFIYLFIYFYLLFRIYIIEIGGERRGLRPSLFVRRRLGVRLVFPLCVSFAGL